MKKVFGYLADRIVVLHLIILIIGEIVVNFAEKLFITLCNIVAIINLIWMALSFLFLFFAFFIKGKDEVLDPTDWGEITDSFFNFYCHPHGVVRICIVCAIIIITLWRWVHFFLNMKFIKENYLMK